MGNLHEINWLICMFRLWHFGACCCLCGLPGGRAGDPKELLPAAPAVWGHFQTFPGVHTLAASKPVILKSHLATELCFFPLL